MGLEIVPLLGPVRTELTREGGLFVTLVLAMLLQVSLVLVHSVASITWEISTLYSDKP